MKNTIHIASAIILNTSDEMLVVRKRKSSYFMLPGGKLEKEESLIDALLRELNEELGLVFDKSDFTFLGSHVTEAANEQNTLVQGNIFLLNSKIDFTSIVNQAEIEEINSISKTNYTTFQLAHLLREFALPRWLSNFQ